MVKRTEFGNRFGREGGQKGPHLPLFPLLQPTIDVTLKPRVCVVTVVGPKEACDPAIDVGRRRRGCLASAGRPQAARAAAVAHVDVGRDDGPSDAAPNDDFSDRHEPRTNRTAPNDHIASPALPPSGRRHPSDATRWRSRPPRRRDAFGRTGLLTIPRTGNRFRLLSMTAD